MDYSKVFHLVARASKKKSVPCILIGGFAINFYKITRDTLDVDFLTTKEDFTKIKDTLIAAGYAGKIATDVAIRFSNKKEAIDIDFMIVDEATRERIIKDGKKTDIVGEELIIPSPVHLIALKAHAIKNNRANRLWKDLPDIVNLIKINKIDYHDKRFREMCLKHGDEELYQIILKAIGGKI